MHRTIFSQGVVPILMVAVLCLADLAQPASAQPQTEAEAKGEEPKAASIQTSTMEELVPLAIKLPKPYSYPYGMTVAPRDRKNFDYETFLHPPKPIMVPKGIQLLSLNKKVTSSDDDIYIGNTAQVTDGEKEWNDANYVELGPGLQWIQIDLGEPCEVFVIDVWRDYGAINKIYHDVVVRCADAPDFTAGVKTLFNNDHDNTAGFGQGTDLEYIDRNWGKLIDCRDKQGKPVRTRYIRCYSNGNTVNDMNDYVEVEVYGRPCTTPRQ